MSAMSFTPQQQHAIDVRGRNVLVSAAAGSGKTAVLTQRVIELLTGDPAVSADRLIIVTFTVAAAVEMKQRIDQKLTALLEEHPDSELLRSQQLLLSKAKISTIHALCNELVKENFQVLGLPIGYRLGEDNELQTIKNDVLEQVIEEQYAAASPDFLALADYFSAKDDRKLLEVLQAVYDTIRSFPFPLSRLDGYLALYADDRPFLETPWGVVLAAQVRPMLGQAANALRQALREMKTDELVEQKYGEAMEDDLQTVKLIQNAMEQLDWDRACTTLRGYEKKRLGQMRGYDDKEFLERLKALREQAADIFKKLKERFLITTQAEYDEDRELLCSQTKTLFDTVRLFYTRLEEEKLARGVIDFADLEHRTLELLIQSDSGEYRKTELAQALSLRYEEIMVDECQDINLVQNLIFWALSKSGNVAKKASDDVLTGSQNLFLVGDVKQSIYRFRNAMPSLFVRRKKLFSTYEIAPDAENVKIQLQNNFRSRTEVTDAVNAIFERLMTEELGDVTYDEEEALVAAANYLPVSNAQTELHFVSTDVGKKRSGLELLNEEEDEASADGKSDLEAAYIAELIERMVSTGYEVQDGGQLRPCTYRDFCILLRAKKGKTDRYVEKLKQLGISCYADASSGYFDSFEISVMLNLLRVIDNPLLDIPLFSVLISPMFGFSPDKLAEIRLKERKAPLYFGVQRCAQEGDTQCTKFLEDLNVLREQAVVLSADRLIQKIYDQTGFLFVVESMVSGEQKRANLRLLLSYAQSYEKIGYAGLAGFIRFIDRAVERGDDFSCANTVSERADVVRIMSIHGSKGLEFPICIVGDLGKKFNLMDVNKSYLLNGDYGFGMNIRKPEELKEYTNLPLEAIKLASRHETLSEELRTLYVALTRAKEKLILVGTANKLESKVIKQVQSIRENGGVSPFDLFSQQSYLDWMVSALYKSKSFCEAFDLSGGEEELPIRCLLIPREGTQTQEPAEPAFTAKPNEAIVRQLEQSISYEYPYRELSELPAKVTVTKIAKAKQQEEHAPLEELNLLDSDVLTGAQRGTILHSFMQYADFVRAEENLDAEIHRLQEQGFLSQQETAALNIKKIHAFLQSDLLHRMTRAEKLYREYQFLYEIDAQEVNADVSEAYRKEKILIQGIADSVFEEADGMVIVDYKTDRLAKPEEFLERYADQLRIYREALNQYFDKPVKECVIYSLHLEQEIIVR